MHGAQFIQDLAVVMLIAGVVTVVFHRMRQPVVLGYIVAGVIIGPHTPPFQLIQDEHTIGILAELGVVFLMFSLGLEFSLKKLASVGATAFVAALSEIALMIWIGYEIGLVFGWSGMDALFLGAMLAISSTTIIVKALDELGMKQERFAQLIFGILIVEDILAIGLIALLSGIATSGAIDAADVFSTVSKLSLFMIVALVIGLLTVPRLLAYVARFHSNEMLLITVLGLCFGFCLLVIRLEYSVALGAFMIGAIMAEARQLHQIERLIEPVRDMFSAIFFVTIGLLFDPAILVTYALPIAVITIAVVLGKVISCSLGAFVAGNDGRTSMRVGMGLSQIGEFSFIIATLGLTLKVTSEFLYPVVVAVSAITTLLTPYLIRLADPLSAKAAAAMPRPLAIVFGRYTNWLRSLQPGDEKARLASLAGRILAHIVVNCALVVAVFLAGAYLMGMVEQNFVRREEDDDARYAVAWGGALAISLPFLIAAYRKLRALSLLLANAGRNTDASHALLPRLRRGALELIPLAAIAAMLALVATLSESILPSARWLLAVLAGGAVLTVLLWSFFVRLHARLQIAIIETLQQNNTGR